MECIYEIITLNTGEVHFQILNSSQNTAHFCLFLEPHEEGGI